jgi:hypothetical protein
MTEDVTWPSSDGPDYGRTFELGFFLDPAADEPAAVLDPARLLDRLGFDLIGTQDHPYRAPHLDTLSLPADNDERTLTTFVHEVAPAVRQHVVEVRAAR